MIARADEQRIAAVMARGFDPFFGEAWTPQQLAGALAMGNCRTRLIAATGAAPRAGEAAAGFALSRLTYDEEELLLFAVLPEHRRMGLGAALLARAIADARGRGMRRLVLEMRRGNRAEALYRAHGFVGVGERRNYYRCRDGSTIDAVTFALTLD